MLLSSPADVLAVMISAKSGVAPEHRIRALAGFAEYLAEGRGSTLRGIS